MTPRRSSRHGTILIIVAGISAMLASLALTFLVRMRSDAQESQLFLAQTQARVMLNAALSYIGETSRIGWDDPDTNENEEAFGWVDIRDGSVGPRDRTGKALYVADLDSELGTGSVWPAVGSSMVCDSQYLFLMPPTAISPNVTPNPIQAEPSLSWKELVGFAKASPMPLADDFSTFVAGNKQPRAGTENPCWFRVFRRKPAVFIITCAAGSSGGFRNWDEVLAKNAAERFGDRVMWESLRQQEALLWYEVEWSPAVNTASSGYIYKGDRSIEPVWISKPFGQYNEQDPTRPPGTLRSANHADHPNKRNQMGTFLYLQRLEREPDRW